VKGYLTLDSIPSGRKCRPLFIPDDSMWLALFGGALTELQKSYNYEKFGTLTPEEMATACEDIINQWYTDVCSDCELPDGQPILRISLTGHFEQLLDGDWTEPPPEYQIPPPEPRTEPTEQDRICLAAKNAANVLNQLYEEVVDGIGEGLSVAQMGVAVVGLIGTLVSGVVGLAVSAVLEFSLSLLKFFIQAITYIAEDTWDEEFTNSLVCLLINCASDDGSGVVTFNYDDFTNGLYEGTFWLDPSGYSQRLAGQLVYLLQIMGIDGLNLAGRTTAIDDDDCSFCVEGWCHYFDFREGDWGWSIDTYGSYVPGEGFKLATGSVSAIITGIFLNFPADISHAIVETSNFGGAGVQAFLKNEGGYIPVTITKTLAAGEAVADLFEGTTVELLPNIYWNANADTGATVYLRSIKFSHDEGVDPFGDPNCP